jgi:glycosyltransferase involved in cell wall biosynthesis
MYYKKINLNYSDLTLIIPARFEHEALPLVLKELDSYKVKKIIIMSKDDILTFQSVKKFNCKIIFQKEKGFGAALIEGLNFSKTKFSCIFNGDGSFNPKYLDKMLLKLNKENYDFIFNSRYISGAGSYDDTLLTKIGNFFFTKICNILFSLNTSDVLFNYVMGKTDSFKKLNLQSKDFCFCVEIFLKIKLKKYLYATLPNVERARIKGKKKVSELKDGLLILFFILRSFIKI